MKGDSARAISAANCAAVLAFIRKYSAINGVSPSVDEVSEGVGLAHASVSRHIQRLERDGKLKRVGRKAIALVGRGPKRLKVEGFVS